MILHPSETIVKRLLYLEDVPIYCSNLKEHLTRFPIDGRKYNVVPAYCLEQGYAFLRKNKVDGIIVDLDILRCDRKQLANCEEPPLDLQNNAPSFPGLGLLLMMQQSHDWIAAIPKLIVTGHPFERYATYYGWLKGPKTYRKKVGFDQVNETITEWLINTKI